MNEYLTAEQDKWHRRYNDAEIEIDRLKRENESYKMAIHRLIMERDCAIKDTSKDSCDVCIHPILGDDLCSQPSVKGVDCYRWRGVKR